MSIGTPRAHDTRNDALGASCSPAALRRSSLTPVWLNSTVKCQSGFGLGETEEEQRGTLGITASFERGEQWWRRGH